MLVAILVILVFGLFFLVPMVWLVVDQMPQRLDMAVAKLSKQINSMDRPNSIASPDPTCGCGHSLAFHEAETQRCRATEQRIVSQDDNIYHRTYRPYPCRCQRYVGPEYLPAVLP